MRVARIQHEGEIHYGSVETEGWARLFDRAPWLGGELGDKVVSFTERTLLSPVEPTKIVCIGKNYAAHAEEMGGEAPKEPLLFLKAPSALLAPSGTIELPPESEQVEHEGELGVVIGRELRRASLEEARDAIFGVVPVNDVTARDLQRSDGQWTRAKGFDTFCPVGPYVVTDVDPDALEIEVWVGDERRQKGSTRDLIHDVPTLLSYVSAAMTLVPGDLISTGTPSGVGRLRDGDRVEVRIGGVGILRNDVRLADRSAQRM